MGAGTSVDEGSWVDEGYMKQEGLIPGQCIVDNRTPDKVVPKPHKVTPLTYEGVTVDGELAKVLSASDGDLAKAADSLNRDIKRMVPKTASGRLDVDDLAKAIAAAREQDAGQQEAFLAAKSAVSAAPDSAAR